MQVDYKMISNSFPSLGHGSVEDQYVAGLSHGLPEGAHMDGTWKSRIVFVVTTSLTFCFGVRAISGQNRNQQG